MKFLLFLVPCILAVSLAAPSKRQFAGICVTECSFGLGANCPSGTVCTSNGCGQTCQKTRKLLDFHGCDYMTMLLCDLPCPNSGRYATDAKGCRICKCA